MNLKSSDAEDGTFWLWGSIPCLLKLWLLKSTKHQQACYCLCMTDKIYCCSRVNFIYLGQAKCKIWFKMWIHLLWSLKQCRTFRVNIVNSCSPKAQWRWSPCIKPAPPKRTVSLWWAAPLVCSPWRAAGRACSGSSSGDHRNHTLPARQRYEHLGAGWHEGHWL